MVACEVVVVVMVTSYCLVILPVLMESAIHIGSYDEIMSQQSKIQKTPLRICFDLDNTLVTYPTIPGDYSSVKPITETIQLLNKLKSEGHEIIIHTARRMLTHKHNIGKVIKDIALVTIQTLEQFNIPYDELIFGKPIADIYIDDRAMNPYINNISHFGLFFDETDFIPNKISTNKYNIIERKSDIIYKTGPEQFMKGELYYYQNIPSQFFRHFPRLIGYTKTSQVALPPSKLVVETQTRMTEGQEGLVGMSGATQERRHQGYNERKPSDNIDDKIQTQIEFVSGIPLYYLYKNKLITEKIINDVVDILHNFHSIKSDTDLVPMEHVRNNYFKKLEQRYNPQDYQFEDADNVYREIVEKLDLHYSAEIVPMIHGDYWFSNIILTYNDEYKLIDMRGQVDGILTIQGDKYYDYGKLYQSIIGYDLILNGDTIDNEYIESTKNQYLKKCEDMGLNLEYLRWVTKSLIFGTFHFYSNNVNDSIKNKIWLLLQCI